MVEVGEGLPRRTYTVRVRIVGREHKTNASHIVNLPHATRTSWARFPPVAPFTIQRQRIGDSTLCQRVKWRLPTSRR